MWWQHRWRFVLLRKRLFLECFSNALYFFISLFLEETSNKLSVGITVCWHIVCVCVFVSFMNRNICNPNYNLHPLNCCGARRIICSTRWRLHIADYCLHDGSLDSYPVNLIYYHCFTVRLSLGVWAGITISGCDEPLKYFYRELIESIWISIANVLTTGNVYMHVLIKTVCI